MKYYTFLQNQDDVTGDTYNALIILLGSIDINIRSLLIKTGGTLYVAPEKCYIVKDKAHSLATLSKKFKKLIIKPNKTLLQKTLISDLGDFILLSKIYFKDIIKNPSNRKSTVNSRQVKAFILTRRGKLLLGLAGAIDEMLWKIENCSPAAVDGKWGTPDGLNYLIRKTQEHGSFSFDEMEYIKHEVVELLQGWEHE